MPQEEAQMLESQEQPLEAQEEEAAQKEEAKTWESQAKYVEQTTGECADKKNTQVSSRICKKPAWMTDFV